MYWYGLSSLLLWVLAAVGLVAVMLSFARGDQRPYPPLQGYGALGPYGQPVSPPGGHGPLTAEQILAERFARGEIEEDEFWQRMTTLRAGRPDDPSGASA